MISIYTTTVFIQINHINIMEAIVYLYHRQKRYKRSSTSLLCCKCCLFSVQEWTDGGWQGQFHGLAVLVYMTWDLISSRCCLDGFYGRWEAGVKTLFHDVQTMLLICEIQIGAPPSLPIWSLWDIQKGPLISSWYQPGNQISYINFNTLRQDSNNNEIIIQVQCFFSPFS